MSQPVLRSTSLTRLKNAVGEARDLMDAISGLRVVGESEATEQAFKQLKSPSIVHVIGHGVIRGKEACQTSRAEEPGCELIGIEAAGRAMGLSVIVLEEAYGPGLPSKEDGLLTAQELSNVNLQGTALLVLSQCQMADGIPTTGDGIYGMRRAAALAGVRAFAAPLWPVVDATQRKVIRGFISNSPRERPARRPCERRSGEQDERPAPLISFRGRL